jgi:hypothetical protein
LLKAFCKKSILPSRLRDELNSIFGHGNRTITCLKPRWHTMESYALFHRRSNKRSQIRLEGLELPREVILDSLRQIRGEVSTEELIQKYKTR